MQTQKRNYSWPDLGRSGSRLIRKVRVVEVASLEGPKGILIENVESGRKNWRRHPALMESVEGIVLFGVSLDIENYCTLRLFFDLSTLAGLSRRNLPEAGIRLLFQI